MKFQYKARDSEGQILTGTADAPNRSRLVQDLEKSGLRPIAVLSSRSGGEKAASSAGRTGLGSLSEIGWGKRVKDVELLFFTRDLLSVIHAGLPLISGLQDLAEQMRNVYFRKVLDGVSAQVNAGKKLSEALDRYPEIFSEFYRDSIRAGEVTGRLEAVLERLTVTLDEEHERAQTVKDALRYPLLVLGFMAAAFIVIIVFVIPQISGLYGQFGVELPLPTRIIIGVGEFASANGAWLLIVTVLCGIGFYRFKRTPQGRFRWDGIKIRLPVFGQLLKLIALVRFSNGFQLLYSSGTLLPDAVETSAKMANNKKIEEGLRRVASSIRSGGSLSAEFRKNALFPPLIVRMVAMGEKAGTLEEMLREVVRHYDREIRYRSKNMAASIEPIMTMMFGVMITILALGVFLPMWQIIDVFKAG